VLSIKEASDLYELRAALETLIVTRFVERATDEEIAALERVIVEFDSRLGAPMTRSSCLTRRTSFTGPADGSAQRRPQ